MCQNRDIFPDAVRIALEKDKWTITHDPLFIEVDEIDFFIDIGAERVLLATQKSGQKIAVEIKSFLGISPVTGFHSVAPKKIYCKTEGFNPSE